MDKRLIKVLSIEGIIGITLSLVAYFWAKTVPPCQEMGCLLDGIQYMPFFGAIGFTVITLLVTLLVSGIGSSIKGKSNSLTRIFTAVGVVVILAVFVYIFIASRFFTNL